ncbi:TolC family protein [Dulcicalothrix desertica]|uniref:TolC family protein n=1 Tax=Dulcicalothrix desertica TaxID=32056 RepID=UPI00119B0F0A|nr:TolC family protein [Dulcicalothrix desertica]TWH40805.1 outer membrane protein TolC [Dulcicalothrix desertica PCC 7102]
MHKPPNQHPQPPRQLHLSFRSVSFCLLNVFIASSVITVVFSIVIVIVKPRKILRPAVGVEKAIVNKSKTIISQGQTQSQTKIEQEYIQTQKNTKPTTYDSRIVNTLVYLIQPQKQKNKILPQPRKSILAFKPKKDKQDRHQQKLVKAPSQSISTPTSPIKFNLSAATQVRQISASDAISQKSLPTINALALQISDIVALVLQNNRTIKNAYLERIAQRQDLVVEEDKFSPNITPTVSTSFGQSGSGAISSVTNEIGLEAKMKIPTGGELTLGWTDTALRPKISFNQPLLRGAGVDINRASIQTARLTEKTNVLDLKATLTNTITDAILAYRNLLRAQEQLKIEQLSLKSAQELLEINKALIAAGRLAPVEIIQSETAIANRQVSLVTAQNNLESTKLALLQLLDIDKNTNIVAAEVPKVTRVTLDSNKLRQVALLNQPEYLQAQLNLDKAKLDLSQAKNNRRWDLGLNISYDNTTGNNTTGDVKAGLTFSKTLGDLAPEQRFQRSRVNLLQTENNLKEQLESLEIQVTDRIRDVNSSFSQVQLAQQAREYSERQLQIEREKQRLGRGSGVFEIVSLENSLVEARNAELNATIEYLNALTNLDQSVGTTLYTWQVKIETSQN